MKIVISQGRILDPMQVMDRVGDLVIEDGIITRISEPGTETGDIVRNAEGLLVTPGFIDMHTHLREPGFEYKEDIASGTQAAAAGGFTAVCCMPNTNPAIDNVAVVTHILERARHASARVHPIAALTKNNEGEVLAEIKDLLDAGAVGISDDAFPIQNAEMMRRGMEYCRQFDAPLMTHNEEKTLSEGGSMNEGYYSTVMGLPGIPAVSENIAAARNIMLADLTGCKLHLLHVSTAGTVELLRLAKANGLPVTGETAPHYFTLTDAACRNYDTNAKMNPPLRTERDVQAIREGLADHTLDAIATDHAPHTPNEKEQEFDRAPFGVIGLETAFALTYTHLVLPGVITLNEMIRKMSTAPARILGLRAGTLKPGSIADISIFDPEARWTVNSADFCSRSRNTPFEGHTLQGKAVFTIVGGRIIG